MMTAFGRGLSVRSLINGKVLQKTRGITLCQWNDCLAFLNIILMLNCIGWPQHFQSSAKILPNSTTLSWLCKLLSWHVAETEFELIVCPIVSDNTFNLQLLAYYYGLGVIFFIGSPGTMASWLMRSTPERAVRVRSLTGNIVISSGPMSDPGLKSWGID